MTTDRELLQQAYDAADGAIKAGWNSPTMVLLRNTIRARLAEPERTVTLPPLPDPAGYMTPGGLKAMLRDESTCLVRKHAYLIEDPQGMFTEDHMRKYAIAALRAAGVEVTP